MKIFDLHQDLMAHIRFKDVFGQTDQTDFKSIYDSDIDLVVATAFPLPPENDQLHQSVPDLITEELHLYQKYVDDNKTNQAWQIVQSAQDLTAKQTKLLLHLEGLNLFDGSHSAWQQLDRWLKLGVRSVGTHWNIANNLGGGTLEPSLSLTDLGAEVIMYLEENRIVFDMAHMGRQSFWDATKITKRPLYISHGNADAVCPNIRNYTDSQLKAIAETDGVIGVFFANTFVVGKGRQGKIEDMIAHIDYIKNLIGIKHIAVGSDLGGIVTGGITDLEHIADMPNLFTALRQHGYSETEIDAISHKNAHRVLKAHLE